MFLKNKIYNFQEIVDICDKNNLTTVDCLKDENMVSIEKWNDGDGEDCLFEFNRIKEDKFLLRWAEF